ncbi:MAG: hypothetical protein ACREX9_07805, partial [Gammaproteobacteria bacterium]
GKAIFPVKVQPCEAGGVFSDIHRYHGGCSGSKAGVDSRRRRPGMASVVKAEERNTGIDLPATSNAHLTLDLAGRDASMGSETIENGHAGQNRLAADARQPAWPARGAEDKENPARW